MLILDILKKRRKGLIQGSFEFIKLQIAGNIPFWGTYALFALFDKTFGIKTQTALLVATILAYFAFFIVSDVWVFNKTRGQRNKSTVMTRFIIFMSITALLTFNITIQLKELFGISPYIGQFISAALSITWTFIGFKFWVFAPARQKQKSKSSSSKIAKR